MISFFLRNTPLGSFLIFAISAIVWFLFPIKNQIAYAFFEFNISKYVALSISFILTLIVALLINSQLKKVFFTNKNSNVFVLIFITLSSLSSNYTELISLTFQNIFFGLALYLILKINDEKIGQNLFNSSFIVGGLSLQNFLFIPFLYLIILGIISVRRLKAKDILVILIAFLLPFLILLEFSFISDNYLISNTYKHLRFIPSNLPTRFIAIAIFISALTLLGVVSLKKNRNFGGGKVIHVSRTLLFLFVFSYVIGFFNLFVKNFAVFFVSISLPSAIYITSYFFTSKSTLKDFIFILFITSCVIYKIYM